MVSLITLTCKNYKQLIETLNSISPELPVESIVVNCGNCKSTLNFLKSYDGIIINENDDGISDAFNKGILASSGDYLMVLNSGD
ncbi:MAG: glycosyltransferase, partial [Ignavibacteria bacterium]